MLRRLNATASPRCSLSVTCRCGDHSTAVVCKVRVLYRRTRPVAGQASRGGRAHSARDWLCLCDGGVAGQASRGDRGHCARD